MLSLLRKIMASKIYFGTCACIAWYLTILSGFFIFYCPVVYLLVLNHKLHRLVSDQLFEFWQFYPVGLFQSIFKAKLHHYGDFIRDNEKSIIIMNHRTRVDWNYAWIGLYHATKSPYSTYRAPNEVQDCQTDNEEINESIESNFKYRSNVVISEETIRLEGNENHYNLWRYGKLIFNSLSNYMKLKARLKFMLKDSVKNIPGLGWIMQLNYFLYVKRNWREDETSLNEFLKYYDTLNYNVQVLLFPEGTDLSEQNKYKSNQFALINRLPTYKFVLHPRTTGWAALCSRMVQGGLSAVYDITIAYDRPPQSELHLLKGEMPDNVYFYVKRYPVGRLPAQEGQLKDWLTERWSEKEIILRHFHNEGVFLDIPSRTPAVLCPPRSLRLATFFFIFWSFVDMIFLLLLLLNSWFRIWVLYHTIFFFFISWKFGGMHVLQHRLLIKNT